MRIDPITLVFELEDDYSNYGYHHTIAKVRGKRTNDEIIDLSLASAALSQYGGFQIRNQNDVERARQGLEPYAWSANYHQMYGVELDRAQEMVHVLHKLRTRKAEIDAKFGVPQTYDAYVLHVAAALKIETFVHFTRRPNWRAVELDIGDYTTMTPLDAQRWIANCERKYIEKYETKPVHSREDLRVSA